LFILLSNVIKMVLFICFLPNKVHPEFEPLKSFFRKNDIVKELMRRSSALSEFNKYFNKRL
jgi:hypothetical protein